MSGDAIHQSRIERVHRQEGINQGKKAVGIGFIEIDGEKGRQGEAQSETRNLLVCDCSEDFYLIWLPPQIHQDLSSVRSCAENLARGTRLVPLAMAERNRSTLQKRATSTPYRRIQLPSTDSYRCTCQRKRCSSILSLARRHPACCYHCAHTRISFWRRIQPGE